MASYYLARSLVKLTDEVDGLYAPPDWPTVSVGDGWVGDTSHAARKSDHNPDYASGGVVRAVDIGISGRDDQRILKEVIGDPRVEYVIHKGAIWSVNYGWRKRAYYGTNPHNHHIHVSLRHTRTAETDTRPWFGVTKPKRVKPGPVNYKNVREQFLIAAGVEKGKRRSLIGVRRIQFGLYWAVDKTLVIDGVVGEATLNAWGKWERKQGVRGRPRVPDLKHLESFNKDVWAVTRIDKS